MRSVIIRKGVIEMKQRVIFHVDVNSAFLSWEAAYRIQHLSGTIDLRDIPSAVGGDMSKRHGIILAKSIPAKKYKIQTGESIRDALKKCKNLVLVPPNYELYEKNSKYFMKILREYTDIVEQYSIDEAFMDMTGTESLFGKPIIVATAIKDRIFKELGFSVNIGISNNKLLAKMAGDFKKPNLVHTLYPDEIQNKMWPLPVRDLFFVGRASEEKLHKLGIQSIGELANTDVNILKTHLKKHGEVIWNFANGRDVTIVETMPEANKGYGNSTTIAFDVCDANTAKMVLLSLAETVSRRLRSDNVRIEVIAISIRNFELSNASHQCVLPYATNITNEIHETACKLFDELWNGTPIRHLGVHTSRISNNGNTRQLSLFDLGKVDYEKLERLDMAIDDIRKRYGIDAVQRATFLRSSKIDHMGGGISREKRTVDYSKEKVQ